MVKGETLDLAFEDYLGVRDHSWGVRPVGEAEPMGININEYVDKYGFREELQAIAPVYRDNQMTFRDTIYGWLRAAIPAANTKPIASRPATTSISSASRSATRSSSRS